MLKSVNLPESKKHIFYSVFGRLEQRVIWKYETNTTDSKPSNVMHMQWCPQQDILGHPNVKLSIMHGGLHGTEEGIYHATPMLHLPGAIDHIGIAARARNLGVAEIINWNELTEDLLL